MDVWLLVTFSALIIIAGLLFALVAIASFALGAHVVFKTRRDEAPGLFSGVCPPSGAVFAAPGEFDDDTGLPFGEDVSQRGRSDMDAVLKRTQEFLKQAEVRNA